MVIKYNRKFFSSSADNVVQQLSNKTKIKVRIDIRTAHKIFNPHTRTIQQV